MDYFENELGQTGHSREERDNLAKANFSRCQTPDCSFWFNPETRQQGSADCPACQTHQSFIEPDGYGYGYGWSRMTPSDRDWEMENRMDQDRFSLKSGLTLSQLGMLGEAAVYEQGQIPGYGPITWWNWDTQYPLDGGTESWGIEVKGADIFAANHRFVPGRVHEKKAKNDLAREMGYVGILGLLTVLDFTRSTCDVYGREMPLTPTRLNNGKMAEGVYAFRKHDGQRLLEEIPFHNPFMDPHHDSPLVVHNGQPVMERQVQREPIPF